MRTEENRASPVRRFFKKSDLEEVQGRELITSQKAPHVSGASVRCGGFLSTTETACAGGRKTGRFRPESVTTENE